MTKTLIAVPCMDMVHAEFAENLMSLDRPDGTACAFIKGTLIYNARNTIAQNAIKHGFDRVFWVDSDIILPRDALMKLSADMDAGKDYVSGLYFMRKPHTLPVIYSEVRWNCMDDGTVETGYTHFDLYPQNAVFRCAGTGFGCVLTSVDILRRMVMKYGAPFTPVMAAFIKASAHTFIPTCFMHTSARLPM